MKEIKITEIENIKIGNAENTKGKTGVTVIIAPDGAPCGVDIRGGGPASRETNLLSPTAAADKIHAVALSGGSAFGLDSAGGVMQYLEELGIGFVAYSPLANGLLSGAYEKATNKNFEAVVDYRSRMPQFTPEAMKKNEELMAFLQKTAEEHSATMSQLSLAWMLGKHSWLTAIPSSRKLERIVENAGGAVVKLSAEEIKAIDEALDKLPKSDIFGVKNN